MSFFYFFSCESIANVEIGARGFLLAVLDRVELVDARAMVGWVATESDMEVAQKGIHSGHERLRPGRTTGDTGLSRKHHDAVGQVCRHEQVVVDDECCFFGVHDEALDDARHHQALVRAQEIRGFVDEVDLCRLPQRQHDGNALQLPSRQLEHRLVEHLVHLHRAHHITLKLGARKSRPNLGGQQLAHRAAIGGFQHLWLVRHDERLAGKERISGGIVTITITISGTRCPLGLEHAGNQLDGRCFTGSVAAHQRNHLALARLAGFDLETKGASAECQ